MNRQEVVLVNDNDEATGVMEKIEAHRKGVLHRAFSVFIFNSRNEMLLQQRADSKYHSAGLWTNACCSHPMPGEDIQAAASRRLKEELGFTTKLTPVFHFTYRADFSNELTEHEYDHVFIGTYNGDIHPDVNEVKNYSYRSMEEIEKSISEHPEAYTEWFRIAFPMIKDHLQM